MHEGALLKPKCSQFLRATQMLTAGIVAILTLMFVFYHASFVNKSHIVRRAMED